MDLDDETQHRGEPGECGRCGVAKLPGSLCLSEFSPINAVTQFNPFGAVLHLAPFDLRWLARPHESVLSVDRRTVFDVGLTIRINEREDRIRLGFAGNCRRSGGERGQTGGAGYE